MTKGAFLGTNYTLQTTPTVATLIDGKLDEGHLMCSIDTCFASGTDLDNGSTMHVAKLPKGAIVLWSIITPIASTGIATVHSNAITGDLGTVADPNLFGAFTTLAAGGAAPQFIRPIPDGTTYTAMTPLAANTDVLIVTTAQTLTDGEGVEVMMFYVMT